LWIVSGTTKIKNLDSNISALKVKLSDEDIKELSELVREEDAAGGRHYNGFEHANWRYADTPPFNLPE
jgi:diketogulonate reductase-like aldo/keto reductase